MEKTKECISCKGHFNPFIDETAMGCVLPISLKYNNITYKCPCVSCIVKPICNSECKASFKYNEIYAIYIKEHWMMYSMNKEVINE